MKIRIKNWLNFEKENGIGFTRDINISDIFAVYGVVCQKKKIYFITLADFYTWKTIMLLPNNDNIEMLDDAFVNDIHFVMNKQYSYLDEDDGIVTYNYDWIFAPKWMIEHKDFLALLKYCNSKATKIFEENN